MAANSRPFPRRDNGTPAVITQATIRAHCQREGVQAGILLTFHHESKSLGFITAGLDEKRDAPIVTNAMNMILAAFNKPKEQPAPAVVNSDVLASFEGEKELQPGWAICPETLAVLGEKDGKSYIVMLAYNRDAQTMQYTTWGKDEANRISAQDAAGRCGEILGGAVQRPYDVLVHDAAGNQVRLSAATKLFREIARCVKQKDQARLMQAVTAIAVAANSEFINTLQAGITHDWLKRIGFTRATFHENEPTPIDMNVYKLGVLKLVPDAHNVVYTPIMEKDGINIHTFEPVTTPEEVLAVCKLMRLELREQVVDYPTLT